MSKAKASLPRPAWWPKNPYADPRLQGNWKGEYVGYEQASSETWDAFCDWLDACGEHHFYVLKARVEALRYPKIDSKI